MLWSCYDLSLVYRQDDGSQTVALRDISLSIHSGERLVIVGPNGSGKSTLALLIAGLIEPSSGAISCDGHPVTAPVGAVVFQCPDDNLLGMTVREEIQLCLEHVSGAGEIETETEAALTRFGLAALARRAVTTLSGGEKQVVALACAFASRQPIIVLDEPTSHLDTRGKQLLWNFLDEQKDLSPNNPAIVLVTQYQDESANLDRLLELKDGRIHYDGPPRFKGNESADPLLVVRSKPQRGSAPVLSVDRLSQVATRTWPLPEHPIKDATIEIHPGEAVALCGPIGAGKTTLALMLAGLLEEHSGRRTPPEGAGVVLIQFPERQIFCRTVEDEVAYGLLARGVKREEAIEQSRAALEQVGMAPATFAQRDPLTLSGGQKRRLMLATAAALNAPLYILDEPQSALDREGVDCLARLCASWIDRKSSYILISHDLPLLRSLTSRVILLSEGETLFTGSWEEFDSTQNPLSDIRFADI